MRYTFLSAHCVQGIAHSHGQADITLFEDRSEGLRVSLTANAAPQLHILNRHVALLLMMFEAGIGTPLPDTFADDLKEATEKIERQHRDTIGVEPVVLIEILGDLDAQIPEICREIQDFILCFDVFDKKILKTRLQSKVSAILTGLRIGAGEPLEFRHIADGSYLTTETGRIVHSVTLVGGSLNGYQSHPLTADRQTQVASDMSLALRAGSLERVMRLHAQSLNRSTDNYRAFLAAWSALEILIAKLFPIYQRLLVGEMRSISESPGLQAYLARIATVVGDKYKLSDKFSVLSIYLDGDDQATDEMRIFLEIKKMRDKLSHGEDIDEATLPTRDVQRLFDKYLRNHLRRA